MAYREPQPGKSLAKTHPKLAAQADGWDPRTLTRGSKKKVGWKCSLGHKWEASVQSRSNGNGCPVCAGQAVQVGFNDLATVNPKLASEADGWDPRTLTRGSNKKVGWKCSLGHKWVANPLNRSSGKGCPVCSGNKVQVGFNDLATVNPKLASEADGWDPRTLTRGSNK
ncbi:MAG: zinc-ribbon domain-containing protein, partial [Actinomycetota bacterium]